MPNDWYFPSFIYFVVYGPFADANCRLLFFEISDGSTDPNKGRTTKIKFEISEKEDEQSHENSNPRGCETDQMFKSEAL